MRTLVLDSTAKSITVELSAAAATVNPDYVASWADTTATSFTEGSSDGALNGITPVTIIAAPVASTRRVIKSITIYNRDTAPVTIIVKYNSGTLRTMAKVTLPVDSRWTVDGTFDSNGSLRTTSDTLYVALTGNQSVAGIKTFTDGAAIKGVADGSSPAAGYVGEYISSSVSTLTNIPATGIWGDATSITLSAGDWDVSLIMDINPTGATMTDGVIGIGTTAGNSGAGMTLGDTERGYPMPKGTENVAAVIPSVRKNITASTTYYFKLNFTYTVATPQFRCRMSARRIR